MTSLSPLSPAPKTCSGPSPRSSSANSQRANRAGSTLRRLARPRLRVDRRRRRIRLKWPSRRAVRRSPRPSSPRTLTGPGGDAATPRIRPRRSKRARRTSARIRRALLESAFLATWTRRQCVRSCSPSTPCRAKTPKPRSKPYRSSTPWRAHLASRSASCSSSSNTRTPSLQSSPPQTRWPPRSSQTPMPTRHRSKRQKTLSRKLPPSTGSKAA
mmetsp:Transcript_31523/g.106147  ORF Transcript_31523/g.106147 Transcript_31523/m.106147 type:complete len:214 (+) Transcript_31523:233-874(+)